jgi:hypothetical protein
MPQCGKSFYQRYVPETKNPEKYQYKPVDYLPDKQPQLSRALEKLGNEIKIIGKEIVKQGIKFGI